MNKFCTTGVATLFAGLLLGVAVPAQAQINLDFSTSNAAKNADGSVLLSNITYQGKLYDVKLQWNPFDVRFDVAAVTAVSGTNRVCNLGEVAIDFYPTVLVSTTLVSDPTARSVTIQIKSKNLLNYNNFFTDFVAGNSWNIVQNGREVRTTTSTTTINTTVAPIKIAPASVDLSWSTIPSGSLREALVTNIPTYIDMNSPLTKVVFRGREYACQ